MRVAPVLLLLSLVSPAHAEAGFEEYAATISARPAEQLVERTCELAIALRGAVATFELRQRLVNTGTTAIAAHLEVALPAGARVTSFAWKQRGVAEVALPVRADSPSVTGGTAGITGVDPATLFAQDDGYGIVMQPIAPGDEVRLVTRSVSLATPSGGALQLVLPGRGANLPPCTATITAAPGPGASVKQIRVDERSVRGARATFTHADRPVTVAADLAIAGRAPIAWSQTQALAGGYSATLLTVLAPIVPPRGGPRRVVFVVDGSRSMELVGRHHVVQLVERVATSLPAGSEIEAIVYDRQAARVFGELRPATAANIAALAKTLSARAAANGSDLVAAFQLARTVIDGTRGETTIVAITDGVTPDLDRDALVKALAAKPSLVDVHAIVIDPASTRSPGADLLRAPVNLYGGAYVEVAADAMAAALASIDEWMRPSWVELGLAGYHLPPEVRSGGGFTHAIVHKTRPRLVIAGRGFELAVRPAPAAPIAAIASLDDGDLAATADAEEQLAAVRAAHPIASPSVAFAVLATGGRVAKDRRAVTKGGYRYDRLIALPDPRSSRMSTVATPPTASAIARTTLERLFRDQLQPKAYACYQRALGTNSQLAGTAQFSFRMGRGEVTAVELAGLGDATLDACLLDAAYGLAPPAPDFRVNADDQTIANYPLAFTRRDEKTIVVLGDADSTSPIDIEAIERANDRANDRAARNKHIKVDAKTPLGGMKAPKSP